MSDESEKNTTESSDAENSAYWSANIRLIKGCLLVWFIVSFGFAIILRPFLADIKVGGSDLGFWFAQQGSILFFLVIIFFYSWRMNKIDHEYDVDDE